jgi:hypothetical protein
MSFELVNRISVKKDGVYISTHSNNDTAPFHSVKLKNISEIYIANGGAEWRKKQALIEFVKQFSRDNYLRLVEYKSNEHASITELRIAIDAGYLGRKNFREDESVAVANIIRGLKDHTESEKKEIIDKLDEVFDAVYIERAVDYYLKNGGGKRFKIEVIE